jgi:hypothetical protein
MLLTIAASYNQSGQAERDRLNNLLAWRDDPALLVFVKIVCYSLASNF